MVRKAERCGGGGYELEIDSIVYFIRMYWYVLSSSVYGAGLEICSPGRTNSMGLKLSYQYGDLQVKTFI